MISGVNVMRYLVLLFLFFTSSLMAASPCGTEGSIEERIKNCNSTKGSFALVARDEKGKEIYKDLKSNLLWGDRLSVDFNHYGSQKACTDGIAEAMMLKDVKWRLPTIHEFEVAATHGIKAALPNMEHGFWTSTPFKTKRRRRAVPTRAFLWDGTIEKSDTGDLKDAASVRCIGKDS